MRFKLEGVRLTVVILLALAGLFAGIFVAQHLSFEKPLDLSKFHGTYLQHPRALAPFALTGTDNKPFTNVSLEGQWTMVFFGFTSCGYVCPTSMGELAKMYRILEEDGVKKLPRVVMVSVDPKRDTLEKLGTYVRAFNHNFYGARADETAIKPLARELGVAYEIVAKPGANTKNYDIQHSGAFMLFNPQGQLTAFFTTPHHAKLLAEDYQLLVS